MPRGHSATMCTASILRIAAKGILACQIRRGLPHDWSYNTRAPGALTPSRWPQAWTWAGLIAVCPRELPDPGPGLGHGDMPGTARRSLLGRWGRWKSDAAASLQGGQIGSPFAGVEGHSR